MSTIQELAKQLSDALVTDKRNNGAEFVHLKDNSPAWMTEVIRAVHGDKLPDDTVYAFIEKCANVVAEAEYPADAIYEIEPDIYTSDLTGWLHARADHIFYVDEEIQETGGFARDAQFTDVLQRAQLRQIQEIGNVLISELEKFSE